jgi:glutamate carboxypeptidase
MDIKGGSVIALATLEALASTCPEVFKQLDLVVVFNAAEEEMTPCFGRLLRRELEGAAACLVFETGKYEPAEKKWTVVQARKGRAVWKISAEGVQAHAGNAHHLGDNAIAKLARAVIGIESKTDYQQNLTFNVGQMQVP